MLYVDDKLPKHPKIFRAGESLGPNGPAQALALYMDGLAYAREHLTDGFVPDRFVRSCGLVETPQSVAKALSSRSVRLWHRVTGGYRIHDYHDWNKKASEIKKKRAEEREKKRTQRNGKNGNGSTLSRDVSPGDKSQTSCARASTYHVPRTPRPDTGTGVTSTDSGTSEGKGKLVPLERAAAPPRSSRTDTCFPSPLSVQPADDGNVAVIQRIAHEVFEATGNSIPSPEVVERVKVLCAQRHIDYGAHPDVATSVVQAAVESAAVQRTLVPVGSSRRHADRPTSIADMVSDFQVRLARVRAQAKGA